MIRYALTLFSVILVACAPVASDINQEYADRLAHVLALDPLQIAKPTPLEAYRATRPEATFRLSVLQLANLGHCALAQDVAMHNNQLGKLAVPSEVFKYQVRFIQLADQCVDDDRTSDPDVKRTLTQAAAYKRTALPQYFAFMLSAEEELTQFSRLTFAEIDKRGSDDEIRANEGLATLASIANTLSTPENIDPERITPALRKLHNNPYAQTLLTSARKQINWNQALTAWLSQVELQTTVCPEGKNKRKAEILHNVFNKFSISTLQPYQAQLSNQLQELSNSVAKISAAIPYPPYPNHAEALMDELKTSSRQHAQWWQRFYKVCKVAPV
ncbi:hypothetical protein CWB99_02555 [Pseudoalteromonas rubra]|uniref:DUF3080 domain-containing protein n=1 Tax=Pseudoalteromonas rubra TaxID=43658 RepID=A0A5S3WTX1_9GAMM|nr:DUF3080 family protein [Pseudoalteromonas rubra]TMP30270.1 hypothetical protein CWC00_17930 [Pseudoalteromonas rubra]TMP31860.1 hypothetical protein CWB99_02555 [Pseudoalteromonas rubra]